MLELRQAVAWFAIVGIGLAVQGCWENGQDQLTLLGDGGCRTADGKEGQHTFVKEASLDACKARCFGANGPCTAIEFNTNNSHCEVHSEPITSFEKVEGVTCHVVK